MPEGDSKGLEAQKTIFLGIYGISLFEILFIGKLGTCPQNYTPTGDVEH
jgi:hypothetical protein